MCSGRLPPASNKGDGPTKGAGGSDRSDRSRVDVARVSPRGGRAEGQGLPAPAWASLIRVGRPGLIRPQVFRGVEEEAGRSTQPQAHPLMQRVHRGGSGGSGWLSGCAGPASPTSAARMRSQSTVLGAHSERPWRAGVDRGHLPAGYSRRWSVYVPSAAARRVPPIENSPAPAI